MRNESAGRRGKLDKIYSKVAEELNMDFTGTGDWEITVAYDGVHFSQEGHRKFADRLLEILYNKLFQNREAVTNKKNSFACVYSRFPSIKAKSVFTHVGFIFTDPEIAHNRITIY